MAQIAEMLPLAAIKSVPGTSTWVVSVIERHGTPMPMIDVSQLVLGRLAWPLRSTRLVLVRYGTGIRNDDVSLLGPALEHTTHTRRIDDASFTASGVAMPDARQLGPMANLNDGPVQRMDTEAMLDTHVYVLLFPVVVG